MEFLTTVAVVLSCISGVFIIIAFIDERTRRHNNLIGNIFSALYFISNSLAPLVLIILTAYPIVLLLFWLCSTYTNIKISITF